MKRLTGTVSDGSQRPSGRRGPRGWRWLVPAGAVVLTVLVLIGVAIIRGAGSPSPADEPVSVDELSTAELIDQVASALEEQAANEPPVPDDPDLWFYTKQTSWRDWGSRNIQEGPTVEVWRKFDNAQVAIRDDDEGELRMEDPEESKNVLSGRWESPLEAHKQFDALPEDPEAVLALIHELVSERDDPVVRVPSSADSPEVAEEAAKQPWATDFAAFSTISGMIRVGAPPEAQARLYRALEHVPGTHNAGLVDDGTGNDAIAIGWDQDVDEGPDWALPPRPQILLDPETYAYRGARYLDPNRSSFDDDWIWTDTRFATGIVNEPGQRP